MSKPSMFFKGDIIVVCPECGTYDKIQRLPRGAKTVKFEIKRLRFMKLESYNALPIQCPKCRCSEKYADTNISKPMYIYEIVERVK